MTDQLSLYRPPRARNSDCDASHEAVDRLERSGTRQRHMAIIRALVAAHPALTARQLSHRTTQLDYWQIQRRVKEMCEEHPAMIRREERREGWVYFPLCAGGNDG